MMGQSVNHHMVIRLIFEVICNSGFQNLPFALLLAFTEFPPCPQDFLGVKNSQTNQKSIICLQGTTRRPVGFAAPTLFSTTHHAFDSRIPSQLIFSILHSTPKRNGYWRKQAVSWAETDLTISGTLRSWRPLFILPLSNLPRLFLC